MRRAIQRTTFSRGVVGRDTVAWGHIRIESLGGARDRHAPLSGREPALSLGTDRVV